MSEAWPTAPLGDVAPKADAPMPSADETVWNLSLDAVEPQTGRVLTHELCAVRDLGSTKCSFDEGHVLYSKLRPYLNKVVVPDRPGVGTSELIPLRPDPARLSREFLAFYLRSPAFLEFAARNTRGANLPRLAVKELWKHRVPIPSLDVQARVVARISDAFERVGEIRQLREASLAEAARVEEAVFADFVEDLGGDVPIVNLGEVLTRTQYGTSKKANTDGLGAPCLRMPNIQDGHLNTDDLKHVELSQKELDKWSLERGDVLINRTNSLELVGKAAMFNLEGGPWVSASYLVRLKIDRAQALPEYIAAVINSRIGRSYVYRTARRAIGMVNINSKEIQAMPIPLPDLDQQRAVIERMSVAHRACVGLKEQLDRTAVDSLPGAILRRAFAGEL